jgi:hypothetical protein
MPNTVYRTENISLSRYNVNAIRILYAWYGNCTVPYRKLALPILWEFMDHFEMALYHTDPYHTIPCIMHMYRTVPYWNKNQYVIFARIMSKQLSSVRYGTAPYGTAGGMWGGVVPYGTACAGKYILRRLSVTSTRTVSASFYPASWRQDFAKYWPIFLVVKSSLGCVTIDMTTRVRASLPAP